MDFLTFVSDPALRPILHLYLFILGTIVGSFLNVCIYRLPLNISIIAPRSKCPSCRIIIPWYCNIPLLSYVFLLGKCHNCKTPISPVYPLVELMTGLLLVLLFRYFGISRSFFIYLYFGCCMIVLTLIDYYHRILPDQITLSGIVIGFAVSFFNPELKPLNSLYGILLGGALPTVAFLIFKWIRKKEGLGMGDIKMLGMVGAFLGWQDALLVLFASSVLGSIVAISGMLLFRKGSEFHWPYGTFIGITALADIFWGARIWSWYFNR